MIIVAARNDNVVVCGNLVKTIYKVKCENFKKKNLTPELFAYDVFRPVKFEVGTHT